MNDETDVTETAVGLLREIRDLLAESLAVAYYCPPLSVDANGEPCEPGAEGARPVCPGGLELRQHAREYWRTSDDRDRLYHPLPEDRHYTGPGAGGPTTVKNHNVWRSRARREAAPVEADPPEPSRADPEPEMEEVRTDTPQRVPLHGWAHGADVGVTKQWQATYNRLRPLLATLWRGFDQDWAALWDAWGEHELMAQIRGTDGVFIVTPGSLSIAEMTRLSAEVEEAIGATQDVLL